ncbi:site-2 protease family protein, partial [bacterium]|nr:site-2 protease family protein [bacterium]
SVDLEICTQACKTYSVVVSEEGKIGITILPNYVHVLTYENNKLISGVSHGVNMVRVMVTGISDIFSQAKQSGDYSKAVNTLSGPVGIYLAVDSVKQYGVISILGLAADLSLVLAFMNLLPIPALDGGRILLTLPELLLRKRLNPKLEVILINGSFILLILLMLAVMVKDIVYFDSLKELFK